MNAQLMPYGLLTLLFKHKKTVFGIFFAIVFAGGAYLLFAQPKYESVAQLIVRFGDRSIPEVDRVQTVELTPSDRREIVLAHAAILGSHDLAEGTINAFGLDTVYPDIVADPPTRWSPMDEAVRVFLYNLSVDVGTNDNVISVTLLHPDKELAPKLVRKLIDLYVAHQTAVYQNPQRDFLNTEVKDASTRLATAQNELEKFKGQWRITDYDKEVEDLLKQRGDVDTSLRNAEANLTQAQHRQQELEQLIRKVPENIPEQASSEKYRSLDDAESRLADLNAKKSQMLATYNENSPALASLKAGIATAQTEVNSRRTALKSRSTSNVNSVYQTLQTDLLRTSADAQSNAEPVRVLTTQLAAIDRRLTDLQQNRGTFNDLTREHQIAEGTYRSLSTKYEDARVKDNLNEQRISPATMISQPTLPYRTARPRKLITVLACLFAGIILGIGGALVREALDDRFTTAEQVAFILDLPVLASFERRPRRTAQLLLAHGGTE
jgi:succinoglycan biosynthesis transport protein ExoP